MQITTDAMVIRERNIDDSDRLLTLLTRDRGVITAYARGARRMKSTLAPATGLLCYSRMVLFKHRERYSVDKADINAVFFGIRQDIEKLALASYMAQLCAELIPEGEQDEDYLRLMLNSLHLLEKDKRSADFIKPLFELRLLSMAGYMPNLVSCRGCACYEADPMYFLPQSGQLTCGGCMTPQDTGALPLSPGVLTAMRYIIYSDFQRLFNFALPPEGLKVLSKTCQTYLLTQLDRGFTSLDFLESVRSSS